MRVLAATLASVASTSMGGCAYLTTFTRDIDLDNKSYAMDIKQRVVLSNQRPPPKASNGASAPAGDNGALATQHVICAEPSPDALTVLGLSGSLSLSSVEKTSNASAGLSENGAFIGLRTQSIQLLRDAMYRLCEGYASGAVTDVDFAAMQRRYQSTMLGLIAIEQLTGPVVANQALLTTAATAQAGVSSGDSSVEKAQTALETAERAELDAKQELDRSVLRDQKAQSELSSLTSDIKKEEGKKPENQIGLPELKGRLPAAKQEAEEARLALVDARRREVAASGKVRTAAATLRQATSGVTTSTAGDGQLGDIARASAQSAKYLKDGVVDIVHAVNQSYNKDSCLALITDLAKSREGTLGFSYFTQPTSSRSQTGISALDAALETCTGILRGQ